jgi:cation:H+ antiporter
MSIFIWFLVFVIALAVLVLSSDWFVGAAEKIGLSLGWPPFVVGVIIIGIGTSLPELMSSIMAVVQEQNQIVAGNVFGSNITNIFLIAGLAGVLGKSFEIHFDFMKADAIFLIGSTVLVSFSVMDGSFHWTEGILVLVLLAFYILSSMKHEATEAAERPTVKWYHWVLLIASPAGIFFGADYTIQAVIAISAEIPWLDSEVIAVTAVALGTSLPEVMVTVQAARKKKTEIAIGNIIGSNIFNLLAVMGIPSIIAGFIATGGTFALLIPASMISFSLPLLGAATLGLVFVLIDKKVNWAEGSLFLVLYVYFIGSNYGLIGG